jgi:hypothetical protein
MDFKFVFEQDGDELAILSRELDMFLAYIRPTQFSVKTVKGDEIAVVKSLDEAIPAYAAYLRANGVPTDMPPYLPRASAILKLKK